MGFRRIINSTILGDAPYVATTQGHHSIRLGKLSLCKKPDPRSIFYLTIIGDAPYIITHLGPPSISH